MGISEEILEEIIKTTVIKIMERMTNRPITSKKGTGFFQKEVVF
jgi:hypothetical protein